MRLLNQLYLNNNPDCQFLSFIWLKPATSSVVKNKLCPYSPPSSSAQFCCLPCVGSRLQDPPPSLPQPGEDTGFASKVGFPISYLPQQGRYLHDLRAPGPETHPLSLCNSLADGQSYQVSFQNWIFNFIPVLAGKLSLWPQGSKTCPQQWERREETGICGRLLGCGQVRRLVFCTDGGPLYTCLNLNQTSPQKHFHRGTLFGDP